MYNRLQGHAHGKILESLSVTPGTGPGLSVFAPGTGPGLSVFGHRFGCVALFNIIKKALGRKWECDRTYSCYILCAPPKPGNPKNYSGNPWKPLETPSETPLESLLIHAVAVGFKLSCMQFMRLTQPDSAKT